MTPTAVAFTNNQIAGLSKIAIEDLPDERLVDLVRAASLPFLSASDIARLPVIGRDSLLRLGFLAREFCKNQSGMSRWSPLSE